MLLVEHDMGEHFKEAKEEKYLADNRLFTLIGQQKTRMLNPHYFGKVRRPQKNQKTNFIIVGQIIPAARDYISLINAVQSLAAMGKGDFIVTIIGEGQLNIDDSIAPFFDIKGCLDFSEMYREMEKADFICALLNPTCDFHKKYLNFVTPGALLLSFGFAKPMLIDHAFAEKYSLDDDTAIIYEGDGLLEAMLNAMKMPSDRYVAMGDAIVSLRNKIHDESLHNLKEALKLIEQG